jgi:hypothetical protein
MAGVLENKFNWSVSRDGVFQECPRRYYFQYYGSWGGGNTTPPNEFATCMY